MSYTEVAFLKRELMEAADIISANTNLHPLAESMRMACAAVDRFYQGE